MGEGEKGRRGEPKFLLFLVAHSPFLLFPQAKGPHDEQPKVTKSPQEGGLVRALPSFILGFPRAAYADTSVLRSSLPGRAPEQFPSSKVTTPLTRV